MSSAGSSDEIAQRLALRKCASGWRGNCPSCDYADAFSVKNGQGGRALVWCANGCSRNQLEDSLARRIGRVCKATIPFEGPTADQDARQRKVVAACAIFAGSTFIQAEDPAGRYLARRGIEHLMTSPALRFRGDCSHPEAGRLPAMVAAVHNAEGEHVGLHRTYITKDGRKQSAEPQKASFGPIWGGATRLYPEAPELVIGEGIESSASAGLLLDLPAWAALGAGNLATGLVLPPGVRSIIIAADQDRCGADAARRAAHRWRGEGRRVRIAWPDDADRDFNDLLMKSMGENCHAA